MPIRVAIVEDSRALRDDLVRLVESDPALACAGACGTAEEAIATFPTLQPDVVLLDIQLPGMSGIQAVSVLRERLPAAQVMMLTQSEDPDLIFQSIAAGATGYLVKSHSLPRLREAIRELHDGGSPITSSIARHVLNAFAEQRPPGKQAAVPAPTPSSSAPGGEIDTLTAREREVLERLSRGRRIKEVADQLNVSPRTVDGYLQRIYLKLHVRNKAGAIARFRQR